MLQLLVAPSIMNYELVIDEKFVANTSLCYRNNYNLKFITNIASQGIEDSFFCQKSRFRVTMRYEILLWEI